jgi:hypothetical protein
MAPFTVDGHAVRGARAAGHEDLQIGTVRGSGQDAPSTDIEKEETSRRSRTSGSGGDAPQACLDARENDHGNHKA